MPFSGTIIGMNAETHAVSQWLATPLGRRCLANEQRLMRSALERVFGEQLVQIGAWGARNTFLRYARTQRRMLVDWRPGVAADVVPRLFTPFSSTKEGGKGLGLAIVSKIIEEHGGLIAYDAPPEGGARFSIYLPVG